LYAALDSATPDSLKSLLHDLVQDLTFWNLRTGGATAQRMADGKYRVTLDVDASKTRVDSSSAERVVPMNDLVEVGVFAVTQDGSSLGRTLYSGKHWIHSGHQAISVIVAEKPGKAGIDPHHLLIESSGDLTLDNVRPVSISDAPV
jgi:hypothetical protein